MRLKATVLYLLPRLSLLPTPVPTSPQFTNSQSFGLLASHKALSPRTASLTNHAQKRCPGGRRPTSGREGPQGLETPGTRSCRLCAGRAIQSRASAVRLARAHLGNTATREDSRPRSAWHPGHRDPTRGNGSGEAPGMLQAHGTSSGRRCVWPPPFACSPGLPRAGGRVG